MPTDDAHLLNRDELIEELSEANRRLSGTLRVVLGTLDAPDVPTLFSRVLEALRDTVDASGAVLFLAEQEGFRLHATTQSLEEQAVPTFLPFTPELEAVTLSRGNPFGLHLCPPTQAELREGELAFRALESDRDGTHYRIPARYLLPFTSFIWVPVWMRGHILALIAVGWTYKHRLRRSDGELLEAVARYLSVQLAGAQSALKAEHAAKLEQSIIELSQSLNDIDELDVTVLCNALAQATKELNGHFVLVRTTQEHDPGKTGLIADFAGLGPQELPISLEELEGIGIVDETTLVSIAQNSELALWLKGLGAPSRGVFVDISLGNNAVTELSFSHLMFFVLKHHDEALFGESDMSYLRRLGDLLRTLISGEVEHAQDHRIAQALQLGMRSSLQEVAGIEAQGIYSSATADAYVGGDFYDLIRLPHDKACVIMGDVSGKGVEAASVSAGVRTALGAYAWQDLSPAHMVRTLNNYLLGFSRVETFATLFVGMIDLSAMKLHYCSAGHPPAFYYHAQTGEIEQLTVQSGMVGAFEDMRYRDGSVTINEGDVLFLYTDGASEARNSDGNFLGEEGLKEVLATELFKGTDDLVTRILESIEGFTGHHLDDDVALVSLCFHGVEL